MARRWALMVRSLVNYNGEEAHLNWHIDLTESPSGDFM